MKVILFTIYILSLLVYSLRKPRQYDYGVDDWTLRKRLWDRQNKVLSCYSLCNHKSRECTILKHANQPDVLQKHLTSIDPKNNNVTVDGEQVAILCQNCEENTIGHRCGSCKQGFFNIYHNNSRIQITECRRCKCNQEGSQNMFCNSIDGFCKCKIGYTGPFCTKCVSDYHHPIQGQRRIPTKCVPNQCTKHEQCRKLDDKATCNHGICFCHGRFKGNFCEIPENSSASSTLEYGMILSFLLATCTLVW